MTQLTTSTRWSLGWKTAGLGLIACVFCLTPKAYSQSSVSRGTVDLTLEQYIKRVLERNESVQERLLEFEINRRKFRAEYGAFEPELFASFSRERNRRQNTVEQTHTTPTASGIYSELNNIYQGGLEALVPTGAKVQIGYTLRDLRNNLAPNPFSGPPAVTNSQFQTFFGFTASQPLLKNGWFSATLASLRVAALGSDIAFQDYRRQLMIIISTAEASYWNLYLAQEQVRFFQESVATAEKILNDNRSRVQAGKSAEIEVLEAEAGLALRQAKLSEAQEKMYESANKVITLYSDTPISTNRLIRAVDRPQVKSQPIAFFDAWREAYAWNPDYLTQRQKVMQEYVREGYAWNQRLPELNLKGSYGLNGLSDTPARSWEELERGEFPSWSIGLELRIPLGGGIRTGNDLAAARIRRREALLGLQEIETQIGNALDTALHKIASALQNVESYQTAVKFNENLLDSALARLDVGKLESRKVFEIESDLFEARNSVVEASVAYQRALLELELLQGVVLTHRNLEVDQKQLQAKTSQLASRYSVSDEGYQAFVKEMQNAYEDQIPRPLPPDTPPQQRAREHLYQYMNSWDATNPPAIHTNSESDEKLIQSLRKRIEELKK